MSLLRNIKSIVSPMKFEKENKYFQIRQQSFFLSDEHHQHYIHKGWVKISDVVKEEEINSFMDTFNYISTLEGFELEKHLLNSGRLFNPEIRKATLNVINKNSPAILSRIFDISKIDTHTGGAYQVKPTHIESDLLIHQDSTVIDEENEYCLFVWIPFCDVKKENGVISFVEGSHLWGNTQRSLGVPWQFKNYIDILYRNTVEVPVKKGDVLVFDPACIHASSPNLSKEIRHAITTTVLKKNYQLVYYFKNPEMPLNQIEKYYVKEDFYYDYDFISKPDNSIWDMEINEYKDFQLSHRDFKRMIKAYQ
ncbi:MAG: phytanoyl-CoA dioxygenase family protein [Chitinophagales bacterium]|nr:phytanoyl-CoA dioxygenase family protein [Chitinophagales bacterium]